MKRDEQFELIDVTCPSCGDTRKIQKRVSKAIYPILLTFKKTQNVLKKTEGKVYNDESKK